MMCMGGLRDIEGEKKKKKKKKKEKKTALGRTIRHNKRGRGRDRQ